MSIPVLESLAAAARNLTRSKRAAGLTILCIAMGVAASATALSLAWTVTLRPLPFPGGDRLVRVWLSSAEIPRQDVSIPDLADIEAGVPAFERFAGTARTRFVALFGDGAARLRGEAVTPDYFDLLGVRADRGRLFTRADHEPGAPNVALISHATWRTWYGSDPGILGKTFRTEAATFEIAGVLPAGFEGSIEADVVEFWVPLSQYLPARLLQSRTVRQSWAIGLLRPEATLDQARSQLQRLGADLAASHGETYRGFSLNAEPFAENWRSGVRGSAVLLLLAAGALLAIAVVNVAGISLARSLDRRREFALRMALGAGGSRIAALPFLEAALASLAGGILGALASPFLLDALLRAAPIELPAYLRPELTGPMPIAVAAICALAALAAGLLPALEARKAAPASVLNEGGRGQVGGRHAGRAGRVLVGAQVALTTGLVVVVALLGRSFQSLHSVPLGFRTDITRLAVTASPSDLASNPVAFRARLVDAIQRHPDVRAVGLAWPTVPPWDPDRLAFSHTALGELPPGQSPRVSVHAIDPPLFDVLGMSVVAGRGIESRDHAGSATVVVISQALAERLGGAERALGSELVITDARPTVPLRATIVGVATNAAWDGLREQDTGEMLRWGADGRTPARYDAYYAIDQVPMATTLVSIAARVTGNPGDAVAPLSRALGQAAPLSAVHWASGMPDELAVEFRSTSFALYLAGAFGLGAVLLAAIGVFATLSHNVAGRIPEFAIRMALGASPADVRIGVLRSGLVVVFVGTVVGALLAALATRGLSQLLYGVSPADPLAYAGAVTALLTIALVSCWWPARRASTVEPMTALKN